MDIVLVGMFGAFFLALFSSLIELISYFVNMVAVNSVFAIGVSVCGNLLVGGYSWKELTLRVFAGAFLSRAFLSFAEKVLATRPTIINAGRQ